MNPPKLYEARYRPPAVEVAQAPESQNGQQPAQPAAVQSTVEHQASAATLQEIPF